MANAKDINEEMIIRGLETKLARQRRIADETAAHIAALRELQATRQKDPKKPA